MSNPALPRLIKRAVTLRLAGASLSTISLKTGLSVSTLYRCFKKHDIVRGEITIDSVIAARESLKKDILFIENLKLMIATTVSDDLAQSNQLREGIALTLEKVISDTGTSAAIKSRSLVALATALRLSQELNRKALNMNNHDPFNKIEKLPILVVSKMTDEEILSVQNRFKDEEAAVE